MGNEEAFRKGEIAALNQAKAVIFAQLTLISLTTGDKEFADAVLGIISPAIDGIIQYKKDSVK